MPKRWILAALAALLTAAPAFAQLSLPSAGPLGGTLDNPLGPVRKALDPLTGEAGPLAQGLVRGAADMARARIERLDSLVRHSRKTIELDASGDPAVRGTLLLVAPDRQALATAQEAGFALAGETRLDSLDLAVARLAVPDGMDLVKAQALLAAKLPQATIAADTLNFQAGESRKAAAGAAAPAGPAIATPVGMIDGAPGTSVPVAGVAGFARNAPSPSNHGSAVASLLGQAGVRTIYVADVYGTDPAGGSALAVTRGLDWLIGRGVRVVSISLVGPRNPLVEQAVRAAGKRGVAIVAAVGNDGPAAPPSYPASYPGVLAITAVDGRDRALIEAGRALHLDYAAPGADMLARNAAGRWIRVRGTSFATPLAAARVAAAIERREPIFTTLNREAKPLRPATLYGRGLLCGDCRKVR